MSNAKNNSKTASTKAAEKAPVVTNEVGLQTPIKADASRQRVLDLARKDAGETNDQVIDTSGFDK
jgi:hypothetical protein